MERSICDPSGAHADYVNFGTAGNITEDYEGNAYTSIPNWLTWASGRSDPHQILYCYDTGDLGLFNIGSVTSTGHTKDEHFHILPQVGQGHDGTPGSGAHVDMTGSSQNGALIGFAGFQKAPDWFTIEGIRFVSSNGTNNGVVIGYSSYTRVHRCIFEGSHAFSVIALSIQTGTNLVLATISHCMMTDFETSAIIAGPGENEQVGVRFVNNTVYTTAPNTPSTQFTSFPGVGVVDRANLTLQIEGNVIIGSTVADIQIGASAASAGYTGEHTWLGADANVTGDGTAETDGNPHGISAANPQRFCVNVTTSQVWEDAATDKFTPLDHSPLLVRAHNLTTIADSPTGRRHEFATDIAGNTRPGRRWAVGAYQPTALDNFTTYSNVFIQLGRLAYYYHKWREEAEAIDADVTEITDAFEAMTLGDSEAMLEGFNEQTTAWQDHYQERRQALADLAMGRLSDSETSLNRIGHPGKDADGNVDRRTVYERLIDSMLANSHTIKRDAVDNTDFASRSTNKGKAQIIAFGLEYDSRNTARAKDLITPAIDHYGRTDYASTPYFGNHELAYIGRQNIQCTSGGDDANSRGKEVYRWNHSPLTRPHDWKQLGLGTISTAIKTASPYNTEQLGIFANGDMADNTPPSGTFFDNNPETGYAVPWKFETTQLPSAISTTSFYTLPLPSFGGFAIHIAQTAGGTTAGEAYAELPLAKLVAGQRYVAGFLLARQPDTTFVPSVENVNLANVWVGQYGTGAASTKASPESSYRTFQNIGELGSVVWTDFTAFGAPTINGTYIETLKLVVELLEDNTPAGDGIEAYWIVEAFCYPVQYGGGIGIAPVLSQVNTVPAVGDSYEWNITRGTAQTTEGRLQRFCREALGVILPSHATLGSESISDCLTQ